MALISCSECGHKISSKTNACPSCGYSRYSIKQPSVLMGISNGIFKFLGFVSIVIGILLCFNVIGAIFGIPLIIIGFMSFIFPRVALALFIFVLIIFISANKENNKKSQPIVSNPSKLIGTNSNNHLTEEDKKISEKISPVYAEKPVIKVHQCFGNEPGWSIDLKNENIFFKSYRDMTEIVIPKYLPKSAYGFDENHLVLYQGKSIEKPDRYLNLVITRQKCSDNSYRDDYEFTALVISGNDFYAGCCE